MSTNSNTMQSGDANVQAFAADIYTCGTLEALIASSREIIRASRRVNDSARTTGESNRIQRIGLKAVK